jgi:hypothetical protein
MQNLSMVESVKSFCYSILDRYYSWTRCLFTVTSLSWMTFYIALSYLHMHFFSKERMNTHMESNVTPDHPVPRLGKMALVKIDSLSRKITQLYSITTSLAFVVHSAPLLERRHSLELGGAQSSTISSWPASYFRDTVLLCWHEFCFVIKLKR